MFRIILIALALHFHLGPILERPPDLHGLSTWYGPPTFSDYDTMANGEPLDLDAPTVAVDVSHRKEWLNRTALVLTECGGAHRVRVTDTGHLYRAGLFRLGKRAGCRRYWPVGEPSQQQLELAEVVLETAVLKSQTEWLRDEIHLVVADFPMRYFSRVVACEVDGWGKGDTTRVMIWVLDD
jgi:hypothetical protein